jgi:hypothetical protein
LDPETGRVLDRLTSGDCPPFANDVAKSLKLEVGRVQAAVKDAKAFYGASTTAQTVHCAILDGLLPVERGFGHAEPSSDYSEALDLLQAGCPPDEIFSTLSSKNLARRLCGYLGTRKVYMPEAVRRAHELGIIKQTDKFIAPRNFPVMRLGLVSRPLEMLPVEQLRRGS